MGRPVDPSAARRVAAGGGGARYALLAAALAVAGVAVGLWPRGGDGEPPPAPPAQRRAVGDPPSPAPPPVQASAAVDAAAEPAPPVDPSLAVVEGEVHDPRARELAGVEVVLLRLHGEQLATAAGVLPQPVDDLAAAVLAGSATTDSGGRFRIAGVPPRGLFFLRITAADRPPFTLLVPQRPEPGQHLDVGVIRLREPRWAGVRIVDPRGRPLEGATLRPAPDFAGTAAAEVLGAFGALLRVAADPRAGADDAVLLRCGADFALLDVPSWVRELRAWFLRPPVPADPDDAREFTWPVEFGGRTRVWATAPGYLARTVELDAGTVRVWNDTVVLRELDERQVTVFDAAGDAVAGAELRVGWPDTPGAEAARARPAGRTDADGVARVAMPEERRVWLAARRDAAAPWHVQDVAPEAGPCVLRLPARHRLRVRVVDRRGRRIRPAPALRLLPAACAPDAAAAVARHQLGASTPLPLDARLEQRRDALRIDDVPAGDWLVIAGAPGIAPCAERVAVRGDTELVLVAERSESLAGEAFDVGFRALHDATVLARAARPVPPLPWRVAPGADAGRFAVRRPRYAEVTLGIATTALGYATAELGATARFARVVHEGPGVLAGRLRLQRQDADPTGWLVVARRERGAGRAAAVAEPPVLAPVGRDGGFVFPAIEPGVWQLGAWPRPGGRFDVADLLALLFPAEPEPPAARARVAAGDRTPIALVPFPPAEAAAPVPTPDPAVDMRVRGSLHLDGAAVRAHALWLLAEDAAPELLLTDGEGAFRAPAPCPDAFELLVTVPGTSAAAAPPPEWIWRRRFAAGRAAEPVDIALRTTPFSASLRGPGGTGRPAGAWLELSGRVAGSPAGGTTRRTTRADARGHLAIDDVARGPRHRLRVLAPESGWLSRQQDFGARSVTSGMAFELRAPVAARGRLDPEVLGVPDLAAGSRVELNRIPAADGPAVARQGTARRGLEFSVGGLLPGRYRVRVACARRQLGVDGRTILIPPELTGLVVDCGELVVGDGDVTGYVPAPR